MDWKVPLTAFLNGRDPRLIELLREKFHLAAVGARRRLRQGASAWAEYGDRVAELFVEEAFVEALEARRPRLRPRWRAALCTYRQLLEEDPQAPDGLYFRACLLLAIGERARALHHLRSYVRREHRPSQRFWVSRACRTIHALRAELAGRQQPQG